MADLATVTGQLWAADGAGLTDRRPASGIVRFEPVALDESAGVVMDRKLTAQVGDDGILAATTLWPGEWRIMLPDGQAFNAVVEAGQTYTLLQLRGYTPGPGVSVTTLLVPSGAALGSLLAWGEDGLTWADGVSEDAVAGAVADYLAAHPVEGVTEAELAAALADLAIPDSPEDVGADPAGTASSVFSAHVAAADPHPQYLTPVEGEAAYATSAQGAKADSASQPGHGHTLADVADTGSRVAMTPAERTKLTGVATGATANATDVQLRDRATHTGAQAISTVTGLQAALDGKQAAGSYAPALGADDNYVTDAEKSTLHSHANKTALDAVSGTNTGDQTLPTWGTIAGKPAVIAAGADAAAARTAIGAGISSLTLGTTPGTAKPGDWTPDLSGLVVKTLVDAKGDLLIGSAADTLARLAVGTDGQVLTADPGQALGVRWAAAGGGGGGGLEGGVSVALPGRVLVSQWVRYQAQGWGADGVLGLCRVVTAVPLPLSALTLWCFTPDAASAVRAGIWRSGSSGWPGSLLASTMGALGYENSDISLMLDPQPTLTPGAYWLGAVVQGGGGKLYRQYHDVSSGANNPFGIPNAFGGISDRFQHLEVVGVTGALGDLTAATFSAPQEVGPAIRGLVA